MRVRCAPRSLPLLAVPGLALLLAISLTGCTGSSGDAPPPATATPAEATPTSIAIWTPSTTATPSPTASPTPDLTATAAPSPTASPTLDLTATAAPSPTASPTPDLTATAAPSPTASPTPSPTASPSPTPEPRRGIELIESAPGVFKQRTFDAGERIDWTHGIFVLDAETGLTEGYAVAAREWHGYYHRDGGWVTSRYEQPDGEWDLLLQRETGQSWRWPARALGLLAGSSEQLLFRDLSSRGGFMIVSSEMEEVARFWIEGGGGTRALFSPDGQTIALEAAGTIYLIRVDSAIPAILSGLHSGEGVGKARLDSGHWRYRGPGFRIWSSDADRFDEARHEGEHYFGWEGHPFSCPGRPSPDGRYTAWFEGGPVFAAYEGFIPLDNPWPSVVIAEAETCTPLLRVLSARTEERVWSAEWLSTSDGLVIGVHDGYAIARVSPAVELVHLASPRTKGPWDTGFQPAPTGDGC